MGTFVVSGRCIAQVTHTGMNTRFGKISSIISTAEKDCRSEKNKQNRKSHGNNSGRSFSPHGRVILLESETITSELLISVLILVIALSVSAFPEVASCFNHFSRRRC
jgi:magnesium-transporting ATPase (P-type)